MYLWWTSDHTLRSDSYHDHPLDDVCPMLHHHLHNQLGDRHIDCLLDRYHHFHR
ncbi:hypothetical protein BD324DRAFT_617843, partial [Kockovaella imperatae]